MLEGRINKLFKRHYPIDDEGYLHFNKLKIEAAGHRVLIGQNISKFILGTFGESEQCVSIVEKLLKCLPYRCVFTNDFDNIVWYQSGYRHRIDGPAIVFPSGAEKWFKNGKLHREDGPAVILISGVKVWYKDGKYHRIGGPAVILPNGDKEWWVNGIRKKIDL